MLIGFVGLDGGPLSKPRDLFDHWCEHKHLRAHGQMILGARYKLSLGHSLHPQSVQIRY